MAINYKLKKRYKKKFDNVLLLDLIESKTYLGEPKFSWDPDIKHHLSGIRNNFCIIDTTKTMSDLKLALKLVSKLSKKSNKILFVGFPRGQVSFLKSFYKKQNHFYTKDSFWVDGFLTNGINFFSYKTNFLRNLKNKSEKDKTFFFQRFEGVLELNKKPDLIFIYNHSKNIEAFNEALHLSIPVVSFLSTENNSKLVDYPVVGNFNSQKGGKLFSSLITRCLK